MKKFLFRWEAEEFVLTEEDLTKLTRNVMDKDMKKSLEEKLILKKMELDDKALREPRTPREYKIRNDWERVSSILKKRYNRLD
jgi:deoxyhypusine synthase